MRRAKSFFALLLLLIANFCNDGAALANDWCPSLQQWFANCYETSAFIANPGYIIAPCHIDFEQNQPTNLTPRILYNVGFIDYEQDPGKIYNNEPGYSVACDYNQIAGGNPATQPLNSALNNGQPLCCDSVGDPINVGTGNVFRKEDDFSVGRWLKFARYYNSSNSVTNDVIGQHWRHTYSRSLTYTTGSSPTVTLNQEDGRTTTWVQTGSNPVTWGTAPSVSDDLSEAVDSNGNPASWTVYRSKLKSYEQYNASGQLVAIQDLGGFTTILQYSTAQTPPIVAPTAGLLISATDASGRAVSFIYNSSGQLTQAHLPGGETYSYGYDASGNLAIVTFPDGSTRHYLYNEAAEINGSTATSLLTGVIDESGYRFETFSYDSSNRAVSNQQPSGAGLVAIAYGPNGQVTVTDALGNTTIRTFGMIGGVMHENANSGACIGCANVSSYTRDLRGNVLSSKDFNGNIALYTYDLDNFQSTREEAVGTALQRTFAETRDPTLHIATEWNVQDANNNVLAKTDWIYSSSGEILTQCSYDGTVPNALSYRCGASGSAPTGVRQSTFSYCTSITSNCPLVGLLLTATGPRTDRTQNFTITYFPNGDVQSITDPMGHIITILTYDGDGRVRTLQDANGVVSTLSYTPRGWLASVNTGGAITTYTYTAYGSIQTVEDPDGVQTTYGYDAAHRLNKITDALGNYVQYTLDAGGNKTAEQIYDSNGTQRRSATQTFNNLGQLVKVADGLGNTIFSAANVGSYDPNGNLLQSTDGQGTARQLSYDALNRLTQVVDNFNGSEPSTQNTKSTYNYDNLSRLTQVTDPSSLNTFYTYDGLSDLTSKQSPDTGASSTKYDAAGNVIASTDAKGITATNTYDALNRLTETSYLDASQNVTYSYDDPNSTTNCGTSYPVGRLTRIIESTVTTAYCYDAWGHVTEKQQITATGTDVTKYARTSAGRISAILYPSGTNINYSRDGDGRIQNVAVSLANGTTITVVTNVTYLPYGPVSAYSLGNGQAINRIYDANYRLTDLTSSALSLHFSRDVMGNVKALGNSPDANPALETYNYDPLFRLTSVGETTGSTIESVTYNQTGDRTSKASSGLSTGTYGYNSGTHQLVTVGNSARTVDANGNTTAISSASGTFGFGFSARNRLTVVQLASNTIATYTYNALGQRIQKLVGSGTSRFDYNESGQLIGEYGSSSRDYVWMDGVPVANVDSTGTSATVAYVTADQLNSPRAITDSNNSIVWQWSYQSNPWGEVAPISNGYVYNLQFAGQYFDAESGLTNNYFRDYDSTVGRYIQSDPTGLAGGISTYAYVSANPLNATDSKGLDDTVCMFNPSMCGMVTLPNPPQSDPNASRSNNPDLSGNLTTGAEVGLVAGAVGGGILVANIIGFPETEIGEGAVAAIGGPGVATLEFMDALAGEPIGSIAIGAISGGGIGTVAGGAMAMALTPPTTSPAFYAQPSPPQRQGPLYTGFCPN